MLSHLGELGQPEKDSYLQLSFSDVLRSCQFAEPERCSFGRWFGQYRT